MSIWSDASKEDRRKIRKEMLVQADKALASLYPIAAQRHAAARVLVDRAIKKELEDGKVIVGNA